MLVHSVSRLGGAGLPFRAGAPGAQEESPRDQAVLSAVRPDPGPAVSETPFVPAAGKPVAVADWQLGPWVKTRTPVLRPSQRPAAKDSRNVYNMATLREDGVTRMIYRGESLAEPAGAITGRLFLATAPDGQQFRKWPSDREPRPILEPDQPYESRGIEDPRLVKVDGKYILTYSAWDGKRSRLALATSEDMIHWKKHGPIFPDFEPTGGWTKSGAILPERLTTGPYAGKYVMYFGDTSIYLATSEDLIHWTPEKEPVFSPREGKFDSRLVEPGPPPLMTGRGILLVYNAADQDRTEYATGQILLDPQDPKKVLARSEEPFLAVTQDWETKGYVDNVVFAEGLTRVGDELHLHFGGGDHVIGLAKCPVDGYLFPPGSPWREP